MLNFLSSKQSLFGSQNVGCLGVGQMVARSSATFAANGIPSKNTLLLKNNQINVPPNRRKRIKRLLA